MKKKNLKISAYLIFGLCAFCLSLLFTFPFNDLAPLVSRIVKKKSGVNLTIKTIKPLLFTGLTIGDITLWGERDEPVYHLDSLSASIPLLSLVSLSPEIYCVITKERGTMEAVIQKTDEEAVRVSYTIKTPSIQSLLMKKTPVEWDGKLFAEGNLEIPLKNLLEGRWKNDFINKGNISINSEEGTWMVSTLKKLTGLSAVGYKKISGEASLSKGIIKIRKLTMDGDVKGSVGGQIMLRNSLPGSRMKLKIKFKLSDLLLKKIGPIIYLLEKKKGKDGYYNIDLKGTFARPNPVI